MNELGNTPVDKNYKPSGIISEEYPEKVKVAYLQGYEQAEKDRGWISVKDRLPDTTEYVFTCVKMDGVPQCVGFHYYKDGKWWEGYDEDSVGAVEYWMQIPKFKETKK